MSPITQRLSRVHAGDEGARNALFAAAYEDLRRLAHARLRDGGRNAALDTTTLVNESYLRFVQTGELRAGDRRAFFAYASKVMQSVILDTVRARQAERRGGDVAHVTLSTELMATLASEAHIIQKVHEALDALEQVDIRLALVVRLRFFAGYTMKEIARALKVTERTAQRLWEKARLLLAAALRQ
jgi:RNA polymerase sigma factor (TIGR02999 family)